MYVRASSTPSGLASWSKHHIRAEMGRGAEAAKASRSPSRNKIDVPHTHATHVVCIKKLR
jgi:hypothetical protein